ncbi:D-methionine transport system ATP-binding protein [Candidatus Rickettsiella viridis]|uniref:Cell division ATP-binding protein FtsE n=1 Tax=Candidatus Rickettsiella viridis TaxID=676208 RepID=A0A2Z5UW90_9COXI|nr:ATP-binding cassette domain-containing protein [Candidatus Rickettsiella viridis]BBB15253.1 D-methionine transport system ATP-binding protein [Candidatus Rickettsiella viridis]
MLKLVDIEKTYGTQVKPLHVLHKINLEIKQGEIFGIVGQSGAGKSTLLRCINLLEKPTRGQVWIENREITALKPKQLRCVRRQIAMIFQNFNLLSSKTVYENVALPLRFAHTAKNEIDDKVSSLLALTGLSDKQLCYPAELSGGQKQRVAIARALAYQPKILLCDEATSALDPETTKNILQLLQEINQRLGLTIFLITHEVEVIKTLCDRVALLDRGHLVEVADIVSFFTQPSSALAKKFVYHSLKQELPPLLQMRLKPTRKKNSHAVLRILFHGRAAAEPLIAHLMRKIGIHLNILQANIELLKDVTLGIMVAEVMGDQAPLQQGIDYLIAKGLQVEVMGYVDGSIV